MTPEQDFALSMGACVVLVIFMLAVRTWDRYVTRKFYKKLGQKPPPPWS